MSRQPSKQYHLICGDALQEMARLPDECVDLVAADLPYGVTQNRWDVPLPLDQMWLQLHRVTKPNAAIVLTATQPFATELIASNKENFRYDIVWEKTIASGQLNVNYQPLRVHEHLLVFYRRKPTYNEARTEGEPYSIDRTPANRENSYNSQKPSQKINTGFRHARSVIKISNPRTKDGHPTQKPVELLEYIIGVYSNPHDTVLDCCMGSGTTGEACASLSRRFIGIELNEHWYGVAKKRITIAYVDELSLPLAA